MKKDLWRIGIIFCFVLFASWPLLGNRFIPTHDGEYTIIRFMEFFRGLSEGNFMPRWAPSVNSSYGLPVFIFYYPLINYIGAFFHLIGFDFVQGFRLSMALGYAVAAVAGFFWLKKLFSAFAATIGTIISLFVPYWFLDLYVRGSLGEVWAIALLFGLLAFIEYGSLVGIVLTTAGMITAHNIMAVLFMPLALGYLFIRNRKAIWQLCLGIAAASYFWIPALAEGRYVTGLNTVNFRDHFAGLYELLIPAWGTGLSATGSMGNKMSFQIGIVPLVLIIIFLISIVRRRKIEKAPLNFLFAAAWAAAVFFSLSISGIFWQIIPIINFVQYPWRFVVYAIPVTGFAASYLANLYPKKFLWAGIVLFAVIVTSGYARPVTYEPRSDFYYQSRTNFTDGTVSMGNAFSTVWSPWKQNRPDQPAEVKSGTATISLQNITSTRKHFSVTAATDAMIAVNVLYYPGWSVLVNGNKAAIDYLSDGIISFPVNAGNHDVTVYFGSTPLRMAADAISLTALAITLILGILRIYDRRFGHNSA